MEADTGSSSPEVAELQENISLHRALLASLVDVKDADSQHQYQKLSKTLRTLRKRLASLKSHQNDTRPTIGTQDSFTRSISTRVDDDDDELEVEPLYLTSLSQKMNRKRQRESFGDTENANDYKSRRTTPSPDATEISSPVLSVSSAGSDDLYNSYQWEFEEMASDEEQEMKAYLDSLEQRKQQEKEDAEFARKLQMEMNEPVSFSTSQNSSTPPERSFSQPRIRTNFSIDRSRPPSPPPSVFRPVSPPVVQSRLDLVRSPSPPSLNSGPSWRTTVRLPNSSLPHSTHSLRPPSPPGPISRPTLQTSQPLIDLARPPQIHPTNSNRAPSQFNFQDDGLEEIPEPRFSRDVNSYPSMPGSFPGKELYVSTNGSSVYRGYEQPLYSSGSLHFGPGYQFPRPLGFEGRRSLPSSFSSHLPSQYQQVLADPAQTKEEIKSLLKHIRPDVDLTPEQRAQIPQGLKASLMPHQISGLAWMKKMEDGTNKGGILADDMGLGKTLQAIALMLARPAPADEHRPNLIVAPVALMQQWKRELEKMVRHPHRLSVFVMHGSQKRTTWTSIKDYDVVLTTYGTLASELKRKLAWDEEYRKSPNKKDLPNDGCTILGNRSKFHRIILDEAQWIKNKNTKTAVAACRIRATYRWCLSGTPMQNGVDEMYSLIKFCGIRPYNSYDKFASHFSRPLKGRNQQEKEKAMRQLQVLLRAILLRRTKTSQIDGKPILQLPPKTTVEDRAVFSPDELNFYQALEKNAQIQFNKFLQRGSIGRNYSHALVLLLRLRQCCCHPSLIVQSKDFLQMGNLEPSNLITNAQELQPEVVDRLKRLEAFECPVCMDANENPAIFPCGHSLCSECLSRLCDQALASEDSNMASCPECRAKIDANKITDLVSFLRVYCPEREGVEPLDDDENDVSDSEDDSDDDSRSDGDLRDFIVNDDVDDSDQDEDEDDGDMKGKAPSKGKEKEKPKKRKKISSIKGKEKPKSLAELRKEGLRNKAAKRKYLRRLEKNWQTSAKIEKTLALLEDIRERQQDEKTIVFSSFTSFLDLLEVPLSRHPEFGSYVRFDGSMTAKDRNEAVLTFTDNPLCKVILVSLKAGNAGLNLTAANHVIILDPFWNPFVEYQAADRCYRIGQLRDVTVHRVLIGEHDQALSSESDFTVEDRILRLQEKKKALVETALDESAGQSVARLGVRELGYLFGVNSLNEATGGG